MAAKRRKKKRIPRPEDFSPEPFFLLDFRVKSRQGKPRCQAWNGNKGRQCENLPVKGRGHPAAPEFYKRVCGTHGGKTPSGVESPHWKHGRYSKDLPANLAADYVRSLKDPDLVSLRDQLALIDVFIKQDIRKLAALEEAGDWSRALELLVEMENASASGDIELVALRLQELRGLVDKGEESIRVRDRIIRRVEQYRKVAESERRRMVDLRLLLTVERQMALLGAVVAILKEEISDKDTRRRIAERIRRLSPPRN